MLITAPFRFMLKAFGPSDLDTPHLNFALTQIYSPSHPTRLRCVCSFSSVRISLFPLCRSPPSVKRKARPNFAFPQLKSTNQAVIYLHFSCWSSSVDLPEEAGSAGIHTSKLFVFVIIPSSTRLAHARLTYILPSSSCLDFSYSVSPTEVRCVLFSYSHRTCIYSYPSTSARYIQSELFCFPNC